MNSLMMDLLRDPVAVQMLKPMLDAVASIMGSHGEESEASSGAVSQDMTAAMINYLPLRGAMSFSNGAVNPDDIQKVLDQLNSL